MGIIKWRLQYLSYLKFRIKWDATSKGLNIVTNTVNTQYLLIINMFYVTYRVLHNWNINYGDGQEIGKFCQLREFQKKCWIDSEAQVYVFDLSLGILGSC